MFQDSEQAEGFTDIPKLIAEEDVDFLPYISWISPKHRGKCLDHTELGEPKQISSSLSSSSDSSSESSQTYMPIDSLMSLEDCTVECDYGEDDEDDEMDDLGTGLFDNDDAEEECVMDLQFSPTVSPSRTNCSWAFVIFGLHF